MHRCLPLLAVALLPVAALAAPAPTERAFSALSAAYVDGLARLAPSAATGLGDHRFDAQVTDMSAAGRAKRLAFARATLARLATIDRTRLGRAAQVDAALLDNELRYAIWQETELKRWAWDPQLYNQAAGDALYSLAARDFAPWPVRLRAATRRMEALPTLFAQTRAELNPALVPPIYATTVAKQNGGIVEIAQTMLAPHRATLTAAEAVRLDTALAGLKAAVATHQSWLDTMLVPQAKGDFRLGAKLYDQKMRFALVSDLGRADIKARASAALADTRAEMYGIATSLLAGREGAPPLPATPTAEQQQAAIEAALELSYARGPARDALMDTARATLAQATAFVRAKNLVTVPDAPVRIITMPVFRQGVAVAYCDSPGPLETALPTLYAISPIPSTWSDDQATSFLREYNEFMLHDLSIHEAMPGHYLQLARANASQSVLRSVLQSGPFVEGWAVYAEGMMADEGYLRDDPRFRLTVLKMRLRSITNSLIDIGIQTEGLSRESAMAMMTKGAFQQEREAAGKWTRASLGSVQLLSYFTGYSEHSDLRREAMRRAGARFDLKAYHDKVLSFGSPPTRFVKALMFGEAIR